MNSGENKPATAGLEREPNMEGKNRDTAHGILSLVSPPLSEEARRHFSFLEGPGLGLFYKNPTSKLTTVADMWGWERSVCLAQLGMWGSRCQNPSACGRGDTRGQKGLSTTQLLLELDKQQKQCFSASP